MKIKELLMALAIAIMAALFVGLLTDAVYPAPKYEDFCAVNGGHPKAAYTGEEIIGIKCPDPYFRYREEVDACSKEGGFPEFDYNETGCQLFSSCNFCSKYFNDANEKYNRNLFFIISPIAVLAIIMGTIYTFEVAASGFMFSGILLLVYSTGRYFSDMSKTMRVVVVFIELLLLLLIAKRKMGRKG